MLVPAYLWAVLGAIMLATCVLFGGWSEPAKAVSPPPAQLAITDLGTLGGVYNHPTAINDRGQVVGSSYLTASEERHAVLWEGGKITDLGTLPSGDFSFAFGINNRGQVVGLSNSASGEAHAVLWENGKMTDLGTLPGGEDFSSFASGINNRGQVVGNSSTASGEFHAVLWTK